APPPQQQKAANEAMQQEVKQEAPAAAEGEGENVASLDERRRTKSSPLVRKIAKENNVDIAQLQGSGVSGRVTKNDILDFLQQPPATQPPSNMPAAPAAPAQPRATTQPTQEIPLEPLSVMRKKIAQHMV